MNVHAFATASGYLGAALGVAMVIPQLARTLRNRRLGGVSALSWAMTALACFTWLLYGLRAHAPTQIPGNLLLTTGALVVALAVPARLSIPVRAAAAGVSALLVAAVAASLPPAEIGYLAFAIGITSAGPQLFRSFAQAGRDGESAVSLSAWTLRAASQASWLTYAVLEHDRPVTVAASVTLASALALIAVERRPRTGLALAAGPRPAAEAA